MTILVQVRSVTEDAVDFVLDGRGHVMTKANISSLRPMFTALSMMRPGDTGTYRIDGGYSTIEAYRDGQKVYP